MQDWVLPFLTFLSLGLNLGLGAAAVWWIRKEADRSRHRAAAGRKQTESQLSAFSEEVQDIEARIRKIEGQMKEPRPNTPVQNGMNLTRRSQVLRMQKRGETPEQIAAALCVPLQEVELLLKLHLSALGA